jgi:hypothetical protein
MGCPTSSYATAGIALRVSGALKPHHYDKVETPSVGITNVYLILKMTVFWNSVFLTTYQLDVSATLWTFIGELLRLNRCWYTGHAD